MKKRSTILALVLAAALTLSSQAHAGGFIDFGVIAPTTGSISYAGGAAPLVGSNIQVDNVIGIGTPLNPSLPPPFVPPANCIQCVLNFTTGALTTFNTTPPAPPSWTFGAGGTITIVGGVDLNFDTILDIPLGTTLLSGTFLAGATVLNVGGSIKVVGAGFIDFKDERLTEYFGLPSGVEYMGGLNLSFIATGVPPGAFTSSVVASGDITNMVDLPSSLLLLGSGLAGFAYLSARTRRS